MSLDQADLRRAWSDLGSRGYCVLPDVIPSGRCGEVRQSIERTVAGHRNEYASAPANIGFVPSVINHDQSFAEYLNDPGLMELVGGLLGPHIRISFTSAIINEPGNARGNWHADWPYNQNNAGRIPAPYPNLVAHVTTLWMLSPFSPENGGTLVIPGSHQRATNPTADDHPEKATCYAEEVNVSGTAGSVLVMDSRLWHATAPNRSDQPRVALAVRYAPWWLNLEVLRPQSDERRRMLAESGRSDNLVPSIRRAAFNRLPPPVQELYRHWIES